MKSTLLKRLPDDSWVAEWMGRAHLVTLSTNDDLSFVSMGFPNLPAIRFETNQRGVILGVYINQTDEPLSEITIPDNHSLNRELSIGRPV